MAPEFEPRGEAAAGSEGPSGPPRPRAAAALLVGVGKYLHADRIPTLRYARPDARALARLLTAPEVCGFPEDKVALLTDKEARREPVVTRLAKWLPAQARGAELVVIYFAGHGLVQRVGPRDEGFLLPYDADPDNVMARGVAMSFLAGCIDALEARAVIVCLDCCHAGQVLRRRGQAPRALARDVAIRPAVLQGIEGKGRFLIASCDEGQESLEVDELKHGLFTYHLLRGIRGAGDRDGDGKVGVAELFNYVAAAVAQEARERFGHEQKPWTSSTWAEDVWISAPQASPPPGAAGVERPDPSGRPAGSAEEFERRFAEAEGDEGRLTALLRQLRERKAAEALPFIFRCLGHAAEGVRRRARRAVQAAGWENITAAVERLARGTDEKRMAFVLDGLRAFEAHPQVVGLLDRLVTLLRPGDLRAQTFQLLEQKRLSLGLDKVAALFREKHSPYRLHRALGQGLFTAAYQATDESGELEVVVRVLRPELACQPRVRARFMDLSKKSRLFYHENLVLTREARDFADRDVYYAVRDYVPGVTLQHLLDQGKRFPPADVVKVLRQVAGALAPVHRAGGWHGGIKPSNLFLRADDERVILGDPSLALALSEFAVASDRLLYDFRYAPPELFRDGGELGPPSDFYALGCVAHELFLGRPLFVSGNPYDLGAQHLRKGLPPGTGRDLVGAGGEEFLRRLLAKSVSERYRDLGELLQALDALEQAQRPEGGPQRRPGRLLGDASRANLRADQSIVAFPLAGESPSVSASGPVPGEVILERTPRPTAPPPPAPEQERAEAPEAVPTMPVTLPAPQPPRPPAPEVSPTTPPTPGAHRAQPGPPPVSADPEIPLTAPTARVGATPLPPAGSAEMLAVGGGYKLLRRLGSGGFGEVWLAENAKGFKTAIKIIFRPFDHEESKRELESLELIKNLRHPYLLQTLDYAALQDRLCIVMELADQSLRDRLKEFRRDGLTGIPVGELLPYFEEVAEALGYLHAHKVLHRDVKPDNVLLLEGHAKIADFGLLRLQQTRATHTGSGTPTYMAPEVWQGKANERSDQYSLALAYAEMRLDRRLFPAREMAQLMLAHLQQEPDLAPLPEAEQQVLLKALAKKPEDRYPTCLAFVKALAQAAGLAPAVGGTPAPSASEVSAGGGPGGAERAAPPGAPESTAGGVLGMLRRIRRLFLGQ